MIDINKYSSSKYLLFGSLYFSEGLQLAIATVIIPIYLLEKNFPPRTSNLCNRDDYDTLGNQICLWLDS